MNNWFLKAGFYYIDNGTGRNHKILKLGACELCEQQRRHYWGYTHLVEMILCLVYSKGKAIILEECENNAWFLDLFSTIGTNCSLTGEQLQELEYFTCTTFGEKRLHSVKEARGQIFWEKLQKENKIMDLSLLPPCQSGLELHCKCANFVAKMW